MIFVLLCDVRKCQQCNTCEKLVSGFRTVYDGCLMISETNAEREEVKRAVKSLTDGCPHGAISYGGS